VSVVQLPKELEFALTDLHRVMAYPLATLRQTVQAARLASSRVVVESAFVLVPLHVHLLELAMLRQDSSI
jgi:hypothetical protein